MKQGSLHISKQYTAGASQFEDYSKHPQEKQSLENTDSFTAFDTILNSTTNVFTMEQHDTFVHFLDFTRGETRENNSIIEAAIK